MSRSTWACELKLYEKQELKKQLAGHAPRERVSWNDKNFGSFDFGLGHAPRERVSWNIRQLWYEKSTLVTLHVSVWVEIEVKPLVYGEGSVTLHVSVWVEITEEEPTEEEPTGHAPRERVSWNEIIYSFYIGWNGHAPRERVSWNRIQSNRELFHDRSRSTWACELKCSSMCI